MTTKGVDRYVAAYQRFAANGTSGAPTWLQELRAAGIARFGEVGFPTVKDERWRFTNVDRIVRTEFRAPPADGETADVALFEDLVFGDPETRIVATFVNGRFAADLSSLSGLPEGVLVGGLAGALAEHGDLVRSHLSRHADTAGNSFTALNAAFMQDGAFVYVPTDVDLAQPVQLVFVTTAADAPSVSHPRNLVIVGRGSRMSLVETYLGIAGSTYWTNAVTEVVVGENAVVDAYRVQRESELAFHTATSVSYQERNSVFSVNVFAFGSALSRHDLTAVLDGEGAEATLNGLTLLAGRQHVDHHTTIDHAKPHCNSWEMFNGIFDERARGVFTGRIIVRPGAQKTDSKQTNNNLLLSKNARADSQPQLEIYADDVRCTHGATLGPIDPRQMFYIRSRGLTEQQARGLLTYGFGVEILNAVAIDELRDRLDGIIHGRLENGA